MNLLQRLKIKKDKTTVREPASVQPEFVFIVCVSIYWLALNGVGIWMVMHEGVITPPVPHRVFVYTVMFIIWVSFMGFYIFILVPSVWLIGKILKRRIFFAKLEPSTFAWVLLCWWLVPLATSIATFILIHNTDLQIQQWAHLTTEYLFPITLIAAWAAWFFGGY